MDIPMYFGYLMILLMSIYALFHPRLHTNIGGTMGCAGMALGAVLSIIYSATYIETVEGAEVILIFSISLVGLWLFLGWMQKIGSME